jgi:virginiamycin B lyase
VRGPDLHHAIPNDKECKPLLLARMLISGKLIAALAGFVGMVGFGLQTPKSDAKAPPAAPPVTLPLGRLTPEAVVDAAGERAVLVAGDTVWIASGAGKSLVGVDPKTNKVTKTIALSAPPCGGLVDAFDAIWVPLCGSAPALARVDVKKGEVAARITRGLQAATGAPAMAVSSIWIITGPRTLGRFDPDGNAQVAEINLPSAANALVAEPKALWLANSAANTLTRVDPFTNLVVETITVGKGPRDVATGEGSIWTLNAGDGTVSRVDPKTNKVTETVTLGVKVIDGDLAVGEGSVWVSATGAPLVRIDPRTNHVTQIFTGPGGGAVAAGGGAIWLAAAPTAVWRLDPRLIDATRR